MGKKEKRNDGDSKYGERKAEKEKGGKRRRDSTRDNKKNTKKRKKKEKTKWKNQDLTIHIKT